MKQLLQSVFPKEFFSDRTYAQAIIFGLLYLGTLIAQLFTFEKFGSVVAAYELPGGEFTTAIVTWLLPLTGLLALPFLLSMRGLSIWMRTVSRTAVVALPLFWLVIGLWLSIIVGTYINTGLFGASIHTSAGAWLVLFAFLWLWVAIVTARELPERK